MAGNIIKVTIENTHPPVWRRIVLPERISFQDLHRILQTAFGWEDDHMHDFSFPNVRLRIISPEDTAWGDCELETKARVDEYLERYNWIRYTYDFGDNWEHKIVLEKKDPDYNVRHASIIKAKGDNFQEDTGGVWGNEQERIPFSLIDANEKLAQMSFPKRQAKKQGKQRLEEENYFKEMQKLLKEYEKLIRIKQRREKESKPSAPSKMEKAAEEWYVFWDMKTMQADDAGAALHRKKKARKTHDGEQLMLFPEAASDAGPDPDEVRSEPQPWGIYKMEGGCSMYTLLEQHSLKELKQYCKMLQIPYREKDSRKTLIGLFMELMLSHPEYYLWAWERGSVDVLQRMWRSKAGTAIVDVERDAVADAMLLGVLQCQCKENASGRYVELTFAREAEQIFAALQKNRQKKEYRTLQKLEERVVPLLLAYGVMEMEELERQYRDVWRQAPDSIQLRRFVCWNMGLSGDATTATDRQGQEYVLLPEIDIEKVMEERAKYAASLQYRPYGVEELKALRAGINALYMEWQALGEFMIEIAGQPEEDAALWLQDTYWDVINGAGMTELMDSVLAIYQPDTLQLYYDIWFLLMDVVMNTGLLSLKGYSRSECLEEQCYLPENLPRIADGGYDADNIKAKTHLYEMSQDIQLDLYIIGSDEDPKASQELNDLVKSCGGKNEEMLLLLAESYGISGDMDRAMAILNRLAKKNPQDPSIPETMGMLRQMREILDQEIFLEEDWGDWDGEPWTIPERRDNVIPFPLDLPETYRREEPKIGRNDPCPCGSGRKYKHCCGKGK